MYADNYFPITYFPSDYFVAPGTTPGAADPTTSGQFRDGDVYDFIQAALVNTGEFASVAFGLDPNQVAVGADGLPMIVLTPIAWHEVDDSEPRTRVRHVSYRLSLVVRHENPYVRFLNLDRLACVVQNLLDSSDLGGMCLASLTRLSNGRQDSEAVSPEGLAVLSGEFAYVVSDVSQRSVSL